MKYYYKRKVNMGWKNESSIKERENLINNLIPNSSN